MQSPATPGGTMIQAGRAAIRWVLPLLVSFTFVVTIGLVAAQKASAASNGPYNFRNSAIADQAEAYANGASGGQCLVFVANMIKAAGGPQLAFGYDTNTYQAHWAQNASPVGSLAEAQRGDIVQWGGGAGGNPHTAIITAGGATAQAIQVIDSNFGYTERVGRGSLSSRTAAGAVYRIWRVGVGSGPLSDGSLIRTPDGSVYRIVGGAPLHISTCAYTNGCAGVVNVPDLSGYLSVPRDGALIRNGDNGAIYEVSGGAPLHLGSCNYTNCGASINIDSYPINVLDHLNAVPSNGSFIRNGDNGAEYRVAGGAALLLTSCSAIGGCGGEITIDGYPLGSHDHLNAVASNGTLLLGKPSGNTWVINAGKKSPSTSTVGAVAVNDTTVASIPNGP